MGGGPWINGSASIPLRLFAVLLLISGGFLGCSRPHDFGGFLVEQVTKYGGRTGTNATLPKLEARWTFKRDKNGFEVTANDTSFGRVDSFLRQAFGPPKSSDFSPETGLSNSLWGASNIGVAIILAGGTNSAHLICLRGMRGMGEMLKESEKPWWKKLW